MTPPTTPPEMFSLMSKKPRTGRGNTSKMIKNKASISPDFRMIRQRRSSHIMIKIIRRDPRRNELRRIPTKRNFKKVNSTLSGINCPRGSTTNTRKHRKPIMPEQASRPISLIQPHEIVKLRIFANLNERRKRAVPKKDDHHCQEHYRTYKEQPDFAPCQEANHSKHHQR